MFGCNTLANTNKMLELRIFPGCILKLSPAIVLQRCRDSRLAVFSQRAMVKIRSFKASKPGTLWDALPS